MRKESFEAAQELIKDNLYSDNIKAYTTFDIKNIFSLNRNDWKIDPWKCPYHNGRAMMELIKRIARTASIPPFPQSGRK